MLPTTGIMVTEEGESEPEEVVEEATGGGELAADVGGGCGCGCVGGEIAGTCVTASAAVVTGGVVGVGQITASVAVVWPDGVLDDVGKIYGVTKLQQEIVMVHGSKKCGSGVKACVEVRRAAKARLSPAGEAGSAPWGGLGGSHGV